MGSRRRLGVACLLALVVAACNGSETGSTTTSTTVFPAGTTVPPPTTTTSVPDPCNDVFCVVYQIRPEATWSDGIPVTSADFVFTYETIVDPVDGLAEPVGYDRITDVAVIDDKTVLFAFSEVFGPWKNLFPAVLPAHVMADGYVPELAYTTTAGPFVLDELREDGSMVLTRSPVYWSDTDPLSGLPVGDVGEIQFVPSLSVRESFSRLEGGELDFINPRPLDWMILEAQELEDVVFDVGSSAFWEHIDFNHDDPLLGQVWVREVISIAIDRQALLDETQRRIDPDGRPLDNTFWMTGSSAYERHFDDVFDPEGATQILEDRQCDLGEDGVYSCQGRRMSFTWATTVGDADRERVFELVSGYLGNIGIELIPLLMTPSRLFSAEVFFGGPEVWQIMNFSWKASADPHLANSTYYCEGNAPSGFGTLNVNRYCRSTVENLVRSTDSLIDEQARIAAYNQADELYLSDLAIIPLYQKPSLGMWSSSLIGPELNPSRSTDLWNVGAWSGKDTVVIAVEGEPRLGNPLLVPDDEMAMLRAPLLSGAYGVDSDLDYVPVLVEGAELVVRGP